MSPFSTHNKFGLTVVVGVAQAGNDDGIRHAQDCVSLTVFLGQVSRLAHPLDLVSTHIYGGVFQLPTFLVERCKVANILCRLFLLVLKELKLSLVCCMHNANTYLMLWLDVHSLAGS